MTKPARGRPSLRNHLIGAARELLRDEGPSALTARGVARRAGVVDATIFNNFGDLRGLLFAVAQEGFPEYDRVVACIERGPGDDVDAWLAEVFDLSRLYLIATLPLSVQQLAAHSPVKNSEQTLPTSIIGTLSSKLQDLQRAGRITRKADTLTAAMLLVSAGAHAALTEFTAGVTSLVCDDSDELARRIVAQLALT